MFKQLTTFGIAIIFALGLAACSGGASQEPEATPLPTLPPAEETESETAEEPAEEETTDGESASDTEEEASTETDDDHAATDDAETEDADHMDGMMGAMSDEAMEMINAAMEAGQAGDWEMVVTHMNHLIEMTSDAEHKADMEHLLEEIEAGDTDHFSVEMQAMMDRMMGAMPKMTGAMSDEAMEMVNAAMEAAQAGDWETVATHMNHVLDMSTDAQQKAAVEHLLEEIEEGNTDHFIDEMQELMDNMMEVSPAMEMMQAAMDAAQAEDWETVATHMNHAIDMSTDAQQKAALEHLLEEVEEGNTDHFAEEMEALLQGEVGEHE